MTLRRLLMASALALSFTVTAPAVAEADPISAAVVGFIGFTGTAAAVATFVINSALYAAGNWAVGKAAQALGLNKNAVQERQAQVTSLTLGETPRELIIGLACTGGTLVDGFNFGGKYGTDTTTRCIALCDHPIDKLVGYYVDDQYYAFTNNGVQPGFNGKLSIEYRGAGADGWTPPQHALQNGGWTSQDRLVGITHVWVDTRFDEEVWTQGHPRLKFVVRGLKAYDPRKDAALGYTGPNPHVWWDPATHEFTRNAAVLRYNYQRGIYATGHHGQAEHLLIGRGLSAEEAPPERIIAAANLCDEVVDGEARYTANGVISAAQSFIEVEQMFAAAMAGVILGPDGGVEVEPGQAKAVSVTISDADLVGNDALTFSEFLPDTDGGRINTVVPRYVEPAQGWKDHSGPVHRDLAHIAEDGGPREFTLPLMLVTSGKQASRCAEITRLKARLERRATIVLPPEFAELEEGDWIAWQSNRRHKGDTVRYRVTHRSEDERWRKGLSLEEIASSVYGVPDPIEDKADPPPAPIPVDALQLFGVSVEAITLPGERSTLPAVRCFWDVEVEDTAISAIRAEVRKLGETEAAATRIDDVRSGTHIITNGVWPGVLLQVRLVPMGDPSRPVVPSSWMAVSTGEVQAEATTVGGETSAEIADSIAQIREIGLGAVANAAQALSDMQEQLSEGMLSLTLGHEQLNRWQNELSWINGEKLGTYAQRRTTELFDGQTAIVEDISLIGARTVDGEGWLLRADTVMVSPTETLVNALVRMEAETDTALATALNEISLVASDLSAEITARELLAGVVADNRAEYLAEIQLLVDDLSAEINARELLAIQVGENAGAIVTERNLRISEDEALADLIDALTLDFNGQQASITSLMSITGDLENGLNAVAGLALDVNGNVVGWEFANNGETGAFTVVADEFGFVDPDGDNPRFVFAYGVDNILRLQNVVIQNASVIGDLVVQGRSIARNNITGLEAAYTAGAITLNGTTDTTVQEVWIDVEGDNTPVIVDFNGLVNMRHDPSGSFTAYLEMRRSSNSGAGIQVLYVTVPALGGGNDSVLGMYPLKVRDEPGAGSWRYFVRIWSDASNMTTQEVRARFMSAQEYRTNEV